KIYKGKNARILMAPKWEIYAALWIAHLPLFSASWLLGFSAPWLLISRFFYRLNNPIHGLAAGLDRVLGFVLVMSFQRHGAFVAVFQQRTELAEKINLPAPDGHPLFFSGLRVDHGVFQVHVENALLGQKVVSVRIRRLAEHEGIARVPIH